MRGNSQNGGQTTKSLLTKPQCSGVPIQQAVSLSSSFPRHCLLFVCAFSLKCQKAQGRRNCPCPRLLHTKPPRLPAMETGAVRLLYGYFFQALTQNLARGLLVSPADAGKSVGTWQQRGECPDHPRVCGEKSTATPLVFMALGSPPRMRGKVVQVDATLFGEGITPAHAGKRPNSSSTSATTGDYPRVCGEKALSTFSSRKNSGSPPRMRGKVDI